MLVKLACKSIEGLYDTQKHEKVSKYVIMRLSLKRYFQIVRMTND